MIKLHSEQKELGAPVGDGPVGDGPLDQATGSDTENEHAPELETRTGGQALQPLAQQLKHPKNAPPRTVSNGVRVMRGTLLWPRLPRDSCN